MMIWRRFPGWRGRRGGFTFLEILASVFLLVLLLAPVLYLLQGSSRGLTFTRDDIIAHCAAGELVEQILSLPYEEVPVGVFADGQIADGQAMASGTPWPFRIAPVPGLRRRLEITELTQDGRPRAKRVKATLSWQALPGSAGVREHSLTVLYARELL